MPARDRSDHFDGRRYFNPGGAGTTTLAKVFRMLRTRPTPWPARAAISPARLPADLGGRVHITFIGHSTFLLQTPSGTFLTDPHYSDRASPVAFAGPRRVRPPGVEFASLPHIDVVLLSHNHYDHCDLPTLRRLEAAHAPLVITPVGNRRLLESAGMRRVEELDWWETSSASPVNTMLAPAQHFSARTPFDRNRALWGSFVLTLGERRVYFAADSGYAAHFKAIRERVGAVDLALLPIGAYEPRWFMKDIHMNPAEAVQAHIDLDSKLSVAMHFGTFQLTPEGIDEPVHALAAARVAAGVRDEQFRVLSFGETISL